MPRIFTEDVKQRVQMAEIVIYNWMNSEGKYETNPEECMDILSKSELFNRDWNDRAFYFREDLRTLRDNNHLDIFKDIIVTQKNKRSRWNIERNELKRDLL